MVDDEGRPISGARAGIGIGVVTSVGVEGKSDAQGIFVGQVTGWGGLGYGADKPGYYDFHAGLDVRNVRRGPLYRWEPWNPTVIATLRPILNPVPMYVRYVGMKIPSLMTKYGFDLEMGDYVGPHGRGAKPDVYFTIKYWMERDGEKEIPITSLKIEFPNEGDGILGHLEDTSGGAKGSNFKLPRFAPESGYQGTWIEVYGGVGPKATWQRNTMQNYIFRVRTRLDENGQVKSALYGKIRGYFTYQYRPDQSSDLFFTYYLNPDGTRNLEFDPSRNLFKGRKYILDRDLVGVP